MRYYRVTWPSGAGAITYYRPLPDGTYLYWDCWDSYSSHNGKWLVGLHQTWMDRVLEIRPDIIEEVSRLEILVVLGSLAMLQKVTYERR